MGTPKPPKPGPNHQYQAKPTNTTLKSPGRISNHQYGAQTAWAHPNHQYRPIPRYCAQTTDIGPKPLKPGLEHQYRTQATNNGPYRVGSPITPIPDPNHQYQANPTNTALKPQEESRITNMRPKPRGHTQTANIGPKPPAQVSNHLKAWNNAPSAA
uniref:Uncharacterized protein n=1 Tax=Ditylenchus dipsaci TaxID=166011 RepID=A0A915DPQ3_9BILA